MLIFLTTSVNHYNTYKTSLTHFFLQPFLYHWNDCIIQWSIIIINISTTMASRLIVFCPITTMTIFTFYFPTCTIPSNKTF